MEWIKIEDQKPDEDKVHFLLDGDSVFIKGSKMQPFFFQFSGECKPIGNLNFTHWTCLPELPKD